MSEPLDLPGIGHNRSLPEVLADKYETALEDLTRIAREADLAPKEVTSDEECEALGDIVKRATKLGKDLEAFRVSEKEPYLAGGRAVDGFFKPHQERRDRLQNALSRRIEVFLREKRDEERRRREEEARRKREEEEARLREAEEREAEARAAREAADRAARDEAASATARAEAEQAAIRAERAAERTLDHAALAAEQTRKAEEEAAAKAAELARTRGASSLSTLRTTWRGEIVDRDALDLEALRPYLDDVALAKAVNAFVRAGRRELRGAVIREVDTATIR